MFWLRFFGSRVRDSSETSAVSFGTQNITASATKLKPIESCLFDVAETRETAEEKNVIRSRGGRRSAIDLSTTSYSLDIGPNAVYRMSFDIFANPSYPLASLLKGYTNFRTIHRGCRSRILKAEDKTTYEAVIFKLYDKRQISPSQLDDVAKEVEILKNRSYGTVELLDVFEDDRLFLLSLKDYPMGSLMSFLDDHGGVLSEEKCVKYVALPMVKILSSLHAAGIVHRDIKPEHILFDGQRQAHLCDFYAAGVVGRDTFTDREGTLSYMAPEVVAKPTPEEIFHTVLNHGMDEMDLPSYNEKADVWSLGAVLVETLTGMLPFVSESPEKMIRVHDDHFSGVCLSTPLQQLEASGQVSADGLDFLSKIFQKDPNDRATVSSLLCHPWLQNHL